MSAEFCLARLVDAFGIDHADQPAAPRTDIPTCQANGKTVLLSIGGATYTEGGFTSSTAAKSGAQTVWAMFGPEQSDSSVDRPFGSAVVDGFDFDFESTTSNMAPFGSELRSLMDAATAAGDKQYYLSAAPQCPYPDAADNDMLDGAVSFDFVFIQFYNNYCGVSSYVSGSSTQNNFNFATWDNWAQMVSANPNVKVLMGIPANTGAGAGYVEGSQLAAVIKYSETFSSFGGIMMWDMSQLYENDGFLDEVVSDLAAGTGSTTTTTTKTSTATSTTTTSTSTITSTTTKTSTTTSTTSKTSNTTTTATTLTTSVVPTTTTQTTTATASNTAVAQWGQCGGIGYTGSTTCQSPYTCTCTSEWWCHCK